VYRDLARRRSCRAPGRARAASAGVAVVAGPPNEHTLCYSHRPVRRAIVLTSCSRLACGLNAEDKWQWWYVCSDQFRHEFRHTGLPDTISKRGDIVAEKLTCLRTGCNWTNYGNQYSSFYAEYAHWQTHVTDKRERKRHQKHRAIDGPHYTEDQQ